MDLAFQEIPSWLIFSKFNKIGIQEKQNVTAKKKQVEGRNTASFTNQSFQAERVKFPANDIFVLITDEKQGDIELGDKDVFIDNVTFEEFAGPLIALRKLYSINQLNRPLKKIKTK